MVGQIFLLWFALTGSAVGTTADDHRNLSPNQKKVLRVAGELLEQANVSYAYGGYKVGQQEDCLECNRCIGRKAPTSRQQLAQCPACVKCSLDCSHFTQLVFQLSGFQSFYLTTSQMIQLPAADLRRRFGYIDLGKDLSRAMAGDLLVYRGHVVLLERKRTAGLGDIVHATSGREIRGAGQGIQRVRQADLGRFRGVLVRILRHRQLYLHGRKYGQKRRKSPS